MPRGYRNGHWLLLTGLLSAASVAGTVDVRLSEVKGGPAASVVVMAVASLMANADPQGSELQNAVMDQIDERFVPELLVVRTGTAVAFPNSDQVRHHVYSFSEAKRFELPLYGGNQHDPVAFDRAGLVVVGCNIHDHMVGYVLVVDTPFYAVSDDKGALQLADLPAGEYALHVWHPGMQVPVVARDSVTLGHGIQTLEIQVQSGWHTRRNMAMTWDSY